jgi:dihydrofolate reductase
MDIAIIVAITENNIIGLNNEMPWHLPVDLAFFKKKTTGHHIVMGRKTFESIGGGKPLPNRVSIIVTRQSDYKAEGCLIAHSLDEAIALADGDSELFIIGGHQIYQQALEVANKMYITRIHSLIQGDTSFPHYNHSKWEMISYEHKEANEKNIFPLSFLEYKKKK